MREWPLWLDASLAVSAMPGGLGFCAGFSIVIGGLQTFRCVLSACWASCGLLFGWSARLHRSQMPFQRSCPCLGDAFTRSPTLMAGWPLWGDGSEISTGGLWGCARAWSYVFSVLGSRCCRDVR